MYKLERGSLWKLPKNAIGGIHMIDTPALAQLNNLRSRIHAGKKRCEITQCHILSLFLVSSIQKGQNGRSTQKSQPQPKHPEQGPDIPRARVEYVVLVVGTMDK